MHAADLKKWGGRVWGCFAAQREQAPSPRNLWGSKRGATAFAFVVRGFIPARLRSSRKVCACGVSGEMEWQGLGLLRSPAGASSLATEFVWVKKRGAAAFAFVVRGLCGSNKPWSAAIAFVAREFTPARLRSSRKACA